MNENEIENRSIAFFETREIVLNSFEFVIALNDKIA